MVSICGFDVLELELFEEFEERNATSTWTIIDICCGPVLSAICVIVFTRCQRRGGLAADGHRIGGSLWWCDAQD